MGSRSANAYCQNLRLNNLSYYNSIRRAFGKPPVSNGGRGPGGLR
jgi:hypothetical protein